MKKVPEFLFISMAAEEVDMHPQTLRKYERLGLVRPSRAVGSMRVYTREELGRIRLIRNLVDSSGINLAGVQRLLSIAEIAGRLGPLVEEHRRGVSNPTIDQIDREIDRLFELVGMRRTRG